MAPWPTFTVSETRLRFLRYFMRLLYRDLVIPGFVLLYERTRLWRPRREGPVQKVLINLGRVNTLGDSVMRNSVVRLVRERYPSATIVFLNHRNVCGGSASLVEELFRNHSWVDEFLTHPSFGFRHLGDWIRFVYKLRTSRFDLCVIDLKAFGGAVTPLLLHLCGIHRLVGRSNDTRQNRFIGARIAYTSPHWTSVVANFSAAIGLEGADLAPRFPIRSETRSQREGPGPHVVVHSGGKRDWHRRWPVEHFVELCARLCESYGASVYLLGGPGDAEDNRAIEAGVRQRSGKGHVLDLTPTGLEAMAHLLSQADLFIGNDSGPQHLAVALATPAIVLFGPSDPAIWGPEQIDSKHTVVQAELPCQSCELFGLVTGIDCHLPSEQQFRCLTDLGVDQVWRAVEKTLG